MDYEAERVNNSLFYPIIPRQEIESWCCFYNEAFDKFLLGSYAGEYEKALVYEFEKVLPDTPPWKIHDVK